MSGFEVLTNLHKVMRPNKLNKGSKEQAQAAEGLISSKKKKDVVIITAEAGPKQLVDVVELMARELTYSSFRCHEFSVSWAPSRLPIDQYLFMQHSLEFKLHGQKAISQACVFC
ncbi:hypothetical protein CAPTEDRAFT_214882 [Capitella teleta]|uniref:Uncharacterized protein n=1 Tax=Capitella teleta TaxID=283909 RepID=R7UEI2_CAPTE|nr:hypothetical protein CAPTEDRAFT_214882 [Capitella teleta]|eukprot:ELU01682.1 hypothetical protein CAPTEDRAFT_214882 [Capitella teleta]